MVEHEKNKERKEETSAFFRFGLHQMIFLTLSPLRLKFVIMTQREIPRLIQELLIG